MRGTFGYLEDKRVWIPETEFKTLPSGTYAAPLRGYAFTMAVMTYDGGCLGWIVWKE